MITPSRFHVPPREKVTLHKVCAGPPVTSIFFTLPAAKNPMKRLSGDQKGRVASSVPESGCALIESSGRIHKRVFPEASVAAKARRSPSGEIAKEPKLAFSGGGTNRRTARDSVGARRKYETASAMAVRIVIPATAQAISSRRLNHRGANMGIATV